MKKSNIDVAFELISKKKKGVAFVKLWDEVATIQGMSEEEAKSKVGKFYTALSLDGRFITEGENVWDLKERHKFVDIKDKMGAYYEDESIDVASQVSELDDENEDETSEDEEESEEDF